MSGKQLKEDWSHKRTPVQARQSTKDRYEANLLAPNGTTVQCPVCSKDFVKRQKTHSFCGRTDNGKRSTRCKDTFHNTQNTRRRNFTYKYLDR